MDVFRRAFVVAVIATGTMHTPTAACSAEMSVTDMGRSACTAMTPYCRSFGRTILTCRDAWCLEKRGYSWESIQSASMIAAKTGDGVDFLLREAHIVGKTWRQVAIERGVNWDTMLDSVYDVGPVCHFVQAGRW